MDFILHLSGRLDLDHIEPYVLADLYSWLEAHSGFTRLPSSMPSSFFI